MKHQSMANMLAAWATNAVYKRVFFKWKFRTVYFLTVLVAVSTKINDYIAAHTSLGILQVGLDNRA